MSLDLSSRQVLNKLLAKQVVTIAFFDKSSYDSARVALIKSFKKHCAYFDSLGVDNPYEGLYVQARFQSQEVTGTFRLEEEKRKTNIKGRTYNVVQVTDL
jgi:hypothetical protein